MERRHREDSFAVDELALAGGATSGPAQDSRGATAGAQMRTAASVLAPDAHTKPPKSLSRVLMQATLLVALVLGAIAGLIQLVIDLGQEKEAVEINALELIDSALPAVEEAVYSFDEDLRQRVVDGLFTQRAINRVRITDKDRIFVSDHRRQVERTLPQIGGLTQADEIVISTELKVPDVQDEIIGTMEVTVDRSIVAPAIVDRLTLYFLLACLKNFLLGMVLVWVIYAAMTRYFISFTLTLKAWAPGDGQLNLPSIPHFLRQTEVDELAERVSFLAAQAEEKLDDLGKAVEDRNAMLEQERKLNKLQRQFVSMVSHEFRTPLAIIDGTARRLARVTESTPPESVIDASAKIRKAVSRVIDLMETVLASARLEEGKIELAAASCDIAAEVRDVAVSYKDVARNQVIVTDLDDLPGTIVADAKLLRQVFSNLLSNAVKYSPEGTKITVRGWRTDCGGAAVSVADQGVGIPKDEVDRLCERFFRASTSTGIPGTGIGLNFARQLIELHGGRLSIESEIGKGTTFTVELPASCAEAWENDEANTETSPHLAKEAC